MLMTRISPKLSASPSAAKSRIEATLIPLKTWPATSVDSLTSVDARLSGERERIVGDRRDRRLRTPQDLELPVRLQLADVRRLAQAQVVHEFGRAQADVGQRERRRRFSNLGGIERAGFLHRGRPGVDV